MESHSYKLLCFDYL